MLNNTAILGPKKCILNGNDISERLLSYKVNLHREGGVPTSITLELKIQLSDVTVEGGFMELPEKVVDLANHLEDDGD